MGDQDLIPTLGVMTAGPGSGSGCRIGRPKDVQDHPVAVLLREVDKVDPVSGDELGGGHVPIHLVYLDFVKPLGLQIRLRPATRVCELHKLGCGFFAELGGPIFLPLSECPLSQSRAQGTLNSGRIPRCSSRPHSPKWSPGCLLPRYQ